MAIKELKLAQQALDMVPYYNKINEIIDYINSKDYISDWEKIGEDWIGEAFTRFCDTTHYEGDKNDMDMFRDAIETFIPKRVKQEPNKVELVPLETPAIESELSGLSFKDDDGYACTSISNVCCVLSKYGVHTPKKFTQGVVGERLVKSGRISYENDAKERYGVDMLYSFLTEKGLLEE